MVPETKGLRKLSCRWDTGVWLGFRDESGEVFIGTPNGVIKVRTVRRKGSHEARWSDEVFGSVRGTPWEPEPGQSTDTLRSCIKIPRASDGIPETLQGTDKFRVDKGKLRPRITKSDVEDFGATLGCKACAASQRGETQTGIPHTEACRRRMEQEWEKSVTLDIREWWR